MTLIKLKKITEVIESVISSFYQQILNRPKILQLLPRNLKQLALMRMWKI